MEQLSEFIVNHWILVTGFCIVSGLLIANLMSGVGAVSAQDAVLRINRENAVVVDVRGVEEFARGHIIDAINIPEAELEHAEARLRKQSGRPLLVCCGSGNASAGAARKLQQAGFEDVRPIRGGLTAWRQENLPVSADASGS